MSEFILDDIYNGHTFSTLTMECIQQYQIDHKIFVESFLIME